MARSHLGTCLQACTVLHTKYSIRGCHHCKNVQLAAPHELAALPQNCTCLPLQLSRVQCPANISARGGVSLQQPLQASIWCSQCCVIPASGCTDAGRDNGAILGGCYGCYDNVDAACDVQRLACMSSNARSMRGRPTC